MKLILLVILLSLGITEAQASLPTVCPSSREYVTTLEYLRKKTELAVPDAEARKIADRVSRGCTDAADRFIRVMELLLRAQVSAKDALTQAEALALRSREVAEGFLSAFRLAYSSEKLDLRVQAALDLARALSLEFSGDAMMAEKDFREVIALCTSATGFPLNKESCAALGLRVARSGARIGEAVGTTFVSAFQELVGRKNAGMAAFEAIKAAEEIAAQGDQGLENFRVAYRYALAESGLKSSEAEAYAFARLMLSRTRGSEPDLKGDARKKSGAP